jgi:uncharacterized membrane protein YphA (DoxX/SURF4 family)
MKTNAVLWIVQALLMLLFVFAGGMKLVMSSSALAAAVPLPVPFMRLIAVAELLGGLGLVLPGLLRIRTGLTPIAAVGLVIIMIGATIVTLRTGTLAQAIVPFVVGILATTRISSNSRNASRKAG